MLRGIDVSSIQGIVPWSKVASAGCAFAIVKASTGNNVGLDPCFTRNVDGARAAGLVVGAYHFPFPLPPKAGEPLHDPVAQAGYHFQQCGGFGSTDGELPPLLDLEWPAPEAWAKWGCSAEQIRAWYLAYLGEVERLWGRLPIVYTYPDFAAHVDFAAEPIFAKYPLWSASYKNTSRWPVDGEAPFVPAPWAAWTFWQTSGGTMTVWGVPVDTDVFNGSANDLRALASVGAGNVTAIAQAGIAQAEDEIDEDSDDTPPAA